MTAKFRLVVLLLVSVTIILAGCSSSTPASSTSSGDSGDKTPIKIGLLEDQSGDFAIVGQYKYHAAQLAVEEINNAGGIMGSQVELVAPDPQSNNQRYQEMARKLILEDKVDVVFGGITSASREAIRPIMDQNKMLYFYNQQYEGGVADHYTFATGVVPDHQVVTLLPDLIKEYGPNIYTIAADYNFGQITAQWVKKVAEENGGKIIGEEFVPLGVSQFSSSINKIQQAKPDILITLLAGGPQYSFFEQWGKSGIKGVPMASTVTIAEAYEHKQFKPPALANMYVTAPFIEELATKSPEAKQFVDNYRKKFPDDPYIGMEAETEYTAFYLYKAAVEKAGTTDKEAVIKALESGISYDGPAGKVTIDGKTHHVIKDLWLIRTDDKQNIEFVKKLEQIHPDWLSKEKGVDLTQKNDNKQYTPLD
ncbi:urea ABC transporter substrate-binding protein [Paenibacillus solisilvae]|uniref:Urea ABC transporter substrate-binding protein n=1 Tax=Paenibacillus solisilvae TaxID=2486751 RepID=A0ABW0W6D0_9BACL